MTLIGHNHGPSLDGGTAWRTHCWTKARADLLPHLPIEVLRNRVARAKEIGLDYSTYASVRASTGHDVIGFLFSGNALRVHLQQRTLPADRVFKLSAVAECQRIALVSAPLTPQDFARANAAAPLDGAGAAPPHLAGWSRTREAVGQVLTRLNLPRDGVLLIGDATLEREWSEAGRLAGYLAADRFFAAAP